MTTEIPTTPTTTTQSKPRVRRGSKPYIFHVESKTRPGRFHVADAHHLTCSCEAGRAGRGCWHLRLSLQMYDWFKRQQAGQAARRHAEPLACPCATEAVQRADAPVPPVPAPVPATPAVVPAGDWHASAAQGDRHASAETGMRALQVAFE